MLKQFKVKNYRNFNREITIDFSRVGKYSFNTDCLTEGLLGKMVIYGRNATGKTNLGRALMDIASVLLSGWKLEKDNFLNADAEQDYAEFSYTFQFKENELLYEYSKLSSVKLRDEQLYINGKQIFSCNFRRKECNFENLKEIGVQTLNTEQYLELLESEDQGPQLDEEPLPFLRWLISNAALKAESPLIQLRKYVQGMTLLTVGEQRLDKPASFYRGFMEHLEEKESLGQFEEFLNIMGIKCKLNIEKLPDGRKELYFVHEKLIPFYENASSGTLALADLYRRLILVANGASLLYLDEFDAFYHYEMAEQVIKYFKMQYPKCQIIMTSHNTNLMTNRFMRPDCLFILSGKGRLTAICDATQRELREGHNLKKMYISGEFGKYE